MESYGEILRNAREEKNVTVSDVSRITQISNAYIEALEEERVEVFPGEPYFIGFLTNYCEYLELNRDEILDLYRAKKIQETPTPIELLQKKKPKYLIPLIVSLLVAVIVLGPRLYQVGLDIRINHFYDTFKTYPLSEIITFTICRKGFKIWSFYNSKIKIKQWKVPELNMQLEIEYKETKPTIQELLRYITIDELNDLINQ